MSLLTAHHLSKAFGPDEIFARISVQIPDHAQIALVGPNGIGKTTLLNILIGQELPTTGQVQHKRGLTIGYLPQRPHLEGERSLWNDMLTIFTDLLSQQEVLHELEHALADPDRADEHNVILERYGRLQEAFEEAGGYIYEIEIKRVLQGLGFDEHDFQRPLYQLSGGQVTRALLARLLLEKPELLVMDEPTNHLDIEAVEWLEGYLKGWEGAVLMVSHDRYFMDRVVDTIWEMDFGSLELYRGNYSHYLQQREERHERRQKEYDAQQEFIGKEQEYIRRNIAGQNTRQAKGRLRRLERLMSGTDRRGRAVDQPWLLRPPRRRQQLRIDLNTGKAARTGREVLRTHELVIGYHDDEKPLFSVPDILLIRGEVAAIIGPNGAGKSTLLKTILEQLPTLSGNYSWGANVQIGYFAQAHEKLNESNTILDELLSVQNLPLSKARKYLATYLFTGDDVFRSVSTLSGGERGRLALAKLSLSGANVLLLDEPTNHLDIPAQEVLQDVLADYSGTILLVSHDRYLVDALATQIWAIVPGEMTVFAGPYREYLVSRQTEDVQSATTAPPKTTNVSSNSPKPERPGGLNPFQRKKRLTILETEIHDLEAEIERLTQALEIASAAGQVNEVAQLGQQYTDTEIMLNAKMTEWLSLS